ncbi:16S rRNA (cytidine(1402)-2'-O)-methyltransferase [uncultured Desulfobulbus sp.]|uniref:16S rRNA (cytidine(1402)-2'-O)-methyltransferase n=1 Tax=uncultured Desulfobulbus sp. TaxID=239745 RepID=UPI0029C80625|nr:16S rRNA (cytidine(1402)-2'-O)-methyltransferase [uncultured Desulfobulbus sp.]
MTDILSSSANVNQQGRLYVVATPIGNLGDLSHRVIQTLSTVDLIACEDTRHTKKLCRHLNISTPLVSYFREREQEKAETLLEMLRAGKHIALVSDAGTPAICDPGAVLVKKARAAGIDIEAISGPSALATALSIAGLTQSKFFFGGFLPANSTERKRFLKEVSALPFTLIFYESPHRVRATLVDMEVILGNRQAQLFRELTKIYEECLEGPLAALQERVKNGVKGELVLIVQGAKPQSKEKPDNLEDLLLWYRDELHSSLKQAVSSIASDLELPRSQVYKKALSVWQKIL